MLRKDNSETPIIEGRNLTKTFNEFVAVSDVSLKVYPQTVHAVIGPNGAGKSSLFNLLTKFLVADSGTILFKGKDITNLRPDEVAGLGMVRSFQISAVFPTLSSVQNVGIALQKKEGLDKVFWRSNKALEGLEKRAEGLLERVGMKQYAHVKAGELSYGRRRALEIATTLALDPELLLLDEPMAGLGIEDIGLVADLIEGLAVERTVLMVEHNLGVVERLSDSVTVMCRGEILVEGTYAEVANDSRVVQAYIGD